MRHLILGKVYVLKLTCVPFSKTSSVQNGVFIFIIKTVKHDNQMGVFIEISEKI